MILISTLRDSNIRLPESIYSVICLFPPVRILEEFSQADVVCQILCRCTRTLDIQSSGGVACKIQKMDLYDIDCIIMSQSRERDYSIHVQFQTSAINQCMFQSNCCVSIVFSFNVVNIIFLLCVCSFVVVMLWFLVPPTAKVIRRRDLGLKSHPKDWRSPGSNSRPLVYKASSLTTTPRRLLFVLSTKDILIVI